MPKLIRYANNYKLQFILGPLFKLTEAVFELFTPIITARIIDEGIKNGDSAYVYGMGGALIAFTVAGLVFALIAQYFAAVASQGMGTDLRNAVFEKINKLSRGSFEKFGASSLTTRLTNDINQVQLAVAMFIRLVLRAPFLILGAVIAAIIIDAILALIFIAVTPIIALIIFVIMKNTAPLYRKIQKKLDTAMLEVREGLSGARVVRAFGKEEENNARFADSADEVAGAAKRAGKISALLNPLTFFVMNCAVIAILWFGGVRVDSGAMTQGEVVAFSNYVNQILLSLIIVANLIVLFTRASASWQRIKEVLAENDSEEYLGTEEAPASDSAIQLKDVSFSYTNDDKYALKGINLLIPKGTTLGIIGGTGSGKSTLAELIARLYDPASGQITLGGKELKSQSISCLRKKIRLVPQRAVLFSGTVRENLLWGNLSATDEELKEALRSASADFILEDQNGLDRTVSRGGKNFSGGQKQRLSIARALAGRPDVLILDDSFSALDYATEARIRRAVADNFADTTIIIISQRAHTVRSCDSIAVMYHGHIESSGSHDLLLTRSPIYKEIFESQIKGGNK